MSSEIKDTKGPQTIKEAVEEGVCYAWGADMTQRKLVKAVMSYIDQVPKPGRDFHEHVSNRIDRGATSRRSSTPRTQRRSRLF